MDTYLVSLAVATVGFSRTDNCAKIETILLNIISGPCRHSWMTVATAAILYQSSNLHNASMILSFQTRAKKSGKCSY